MASYYVPALLFESSQMSPSASPGTSPQNPLVSSTDEDALSKGIPPEALQHELATWSSLGFASFSDESRDSIWTTASSGVPTPSMLAQSAAAAAADPRSQQHPHPGMQHSPASVAPAALFAGFHHPAFPAHTAAGVGAPGVQGHPLFNPGAGHDFTSFAVSHGAGGLPTLPQGETYIPANVSVGSSVGSGGTGDDSPGGGGTSTGHPARKGSQGSLHEKRDRASMSKTELELDKRRRNTEASARFRSRKRAHQAQLEQTTKDLRSRVEELESEVTDLKRENGWLRGLVLEQSGGGGGGRGGPAEAHAGAGRPKSRGKKRPEPEVLDRDVEFDDDDDESEEDEDDDFEPGPSSGAAKRRTGRKKRGVGTPRATSSSRATVTAGGKKRSRDEKEKGSAE